MENTLQPNSLSNAFGSGDIDRLRSHITRRLPFYVRMQISSFEARAACLLHGLLNGSRNPAVPYHSFFCSSTSESISGAMKIVRQNLFLADPNQIHRTAVYDPSGWLQGMFDPMESGVDEALVPGLVHFEDFSEFSRYVQEECPSSLLVRQVHELRLDDLSEIVDSARKQGVYVILDETSTDLSSRGPVTAELATNPDVVVFGENLADHKVPCGCFLMTETVFRVWNNGKDYNIHSNTWGGNSASLTAVLDFLSTTEAAASLPNSVGNELVLASQSHLAATKLYQTHCSPIMASMLTLGGLNKEIQSAYQARIATTGRRGRESVIDASGTYGVNLQGHNPDGVVSAVLDRHDVEHDYWQDLENCVEKRTRFSHVFPVVSGATAMETALTISLLAAFPRKRIVALKGGYGGKTLISLVATARERYREPFGPLYPHKHYVDPFGANAKTELLTQLETDDVALVVLETVQGDGGVKSIPEPFLEFLQRQKEKHGFLIVVDEIQTGMYRTGTFLNHTSRVPNADVVLVGKGMSANVFPVSATFVTDQVYHQAESKNASVVARLSNLYRCQFGAQMAIHAIETGERLELANHAQVAGDYFVKKLRASTEDLDLVKDVRGAGLMIGIEFEEAKLPRLIRKSFGGLIGSRCINDTKQPVLVAFNPDKPFLIRFLPPLCITLEEIDAVVDTFSRSLRSGVVGLLKPVVVNVINSKIGRL